MRVKKFFFAVFDILPLRFIFYESGSRKPKSCGSKRSGSASSALSNSMIKDSNLFACRADIPELLGVKHDFERREGVSNKIYSCKILDPVVYLGGRM